MSKKHFIAIAKILSTQIGMLEKDHIKLAIGLADYFQTQNPNFDRQRFINACNVEN